jgi:hypothetical protein
MDRFPFLELYIRLARIAAGIVALLGVIQAFRVWDFGFWTFLLTLAMGFVWAFLILVGADVLGCFKAIEENTRRGPAS